MATTIDRVIEQFELIDKYSAKLDKMAQRTDQFAAKVKSSHTALLAFASVASTAAAGGLMALGQAASKTAADFEALKLGLSATLGDSKLAAQEWKRIREIAKLPGLGIEEAAQGLMKLTGSGIGLQLAERSLLAFGNALAAVGSGKAELEGVFRALGQIQSKGVISAEEINQLAERLPQIRTAMQAAFGTSNTESLQKMGIESSQFLEKIVTEFEKLPKVAGGAKNAFENIGDGIKIAFAAAGEAINRRLVPLLNKVTDFLIFIADSGVLTKIGAGFADMFKVDSDTLLRALSWITAAIDQMPMILTNAAKSARDFGMELGNNLIGQWNAFIDHFQNGMNSIGAAWVGIKNAAMPVIYGIINGVNELINTIDRMAIAGEKTFGRFSPGSGDRIRELEAGIAGRQKLDWKPEEFVKSDAFAKAMKLGSMSGIIGGVGTAIDKALGNPLGRIGAQSYDIFQKFKMSEGQGGLLGGAANDPMQKMLSNIDSQTKATADNTRQALDLKRFALGGGELGAMGIPVIDRYGGRHKQGGGGVTVNVMGRDALARAMQEIAQQVLEQAMLNNTLRAR